MGQYLGVQMFILEADLHPILDQQEIQKDCKNFERTIAAAAARVKDCGCVGMLACEVVNQEIVLHYLHPRPTLISLQLTKHLQMQSCLREHQQQLLFRLRSDSNEQTPTGLGITQQQPLCFSDRAYIVPIAVPVACCGSWHGSFCSIVSGRG